MGRCCIDCFNDSILINYIEEYGSLGRCNYCGSDNIMSIEISELSDLFQQFSDIYEVTAYGEHYGPGQSALDRGELLTEFVQNDWYIFSDELTLDEKSSLFFEIINFNRSPEYCLDDCDLYSRKEDSFLYVGGETIWDEFCEKIKHKNRFFIEDSWLKEFLNNTIHQYSHSIEENTILYRARIMKNDQSEIYSAEKMGLPPRKKQKMGEQIL